MGNFLSHGLRRGREKTCLFWSILGRFGAFWVHFVPVLVFFEHFWVLFERGGAQNCRRALSGQMTWGVSCFGILRPYLRFGDTTFVGVGVTSCNQAALALRVKVYRHDGFLLMVFIGGYAISFIGIKKFF